MSAAKGTLLISEGSGSREASYDLVVGCDGAGSAVRSVLQEQVRGFTVTSCPSLTNHSTMLHLDLKSGTDALDSRFLYILSPPPVMLWQVRYTDPMQGIDRSPLVLSGRPVWSPSIQLGCRGYETVDRGVQVHHKAVRHGSH